MSSCLCVHDNQLGDCFTNLRAIVNDPDSQLSGLAEDPLFELPDADLSTSAYFMPYDAYGDGTRSNICTTIPLSHTSPVRLSPPQLSDEPNGVYAFLQADDGSRNVLGMVFVSFGKMMSSLDCIPNTMKLPPRSAQEQVFFVTHFALDSWEGLDSSSFIRAVHPHRLLAAAIPPFSLRPSHEMQKQRAANIQSLVSTSTSSDKQLKRKPSMGAANRQSLVSTATSRESNASTVMEDDWQTCEPSPALKNGKKKGKGLTKKPVAAKTERCAKPSPPKQTQRPARVCSSIKAKKEEIKDDADDDEGECQRSVRHRSSRGSSVAAAAAVVEGDSVFFNGSWQHLKRGFGWRTEWRGREAQELFVAPGGSGKNLPLEGILYFADKPNFIQHLRRNPCLYSSYSLIKTLMTKQGWIFTSTSGETREILFKPALAADVAVDGVHVFHCRRALLKYIHRFPYPLQADADLKVSLQSVGWSCSSKKWSPPTSYTSDTLHLTLNEVRQYLWLHPAAYLRGVCATSHIETAKALTNEYLILSIKMTDAENITIVESESEDDTMYDDCVGSEADDSLCDESSAGLPSPTGYVLPEKRKMELRKFMQEEKKNEGSLDVRRFSDLLHKLGWRCETAEWLGDGQWWSLDFVWIAPWCTTDRKSLVAGLDYFFDEEDIFSYISKRGHSDLKRSPIKMKIDFTSKSYSRDRRILELAQTAGLTLRAPLNDHLLASGWLFQFVVKPHRMEIWIPHWFASSFDESAFLSYTCGEDYFVSEASVLGYLRSYGNQPKPEVITSPSLSQSVVTERTEYPDSPQRGLEWFIRHQNDEDVYRPEIDVWKILKSNYDWTHENAGTKFKEATIYLAPWGRAAYDNGGKYDPDMMVRNRDYFYDTTAILKYLTKYGFTDRSTEPPTPDSRDAVRPRIPPAHVAMVIKSENVEKRSISEVSASAAVHGIAKKKSKRPSAPVTRNITLDSIDEQAKVVVRDLLTAISHGEDVRLDKIALPIAKKAGVRWFYCTYMNVEQKAFTFLAAAQLSNSKQLYAFHHRSDFFIGESEIIEYLLDQLAKLGYDKESNFIPPYNLNDDEEEESASKADVYTLKPPRPLRRSIDGEPSDMADRISDGSLMQEQRSLFSPAGEPSFPTVEPDNIQIETVSACITSSKPMEISSSSNVAGGRTIKETVDAVLIALLPGSAPTEIIGRADEENRLANAIISAIQNQHGSCLYLCGMSGVGKTVTVEKVIKNVRLQYPHTDLVTTRVCGTGLTTTFSYLADIMGFRERASPIASTMSYFAESLGFKDVPLDEKNAEAMCMRNFCPSTAQLTRVGAKDYPHHILFVDEIDKAPKEATRKLFETCFKENSRLILIGLANDIHFPSSLRLSDECSPDVIVFPALTIEQRMGIIVSRTQGLFTERAAKYIACKAKEGDARLLLDLCISSLDVVSKKDKYINGKDEIFCGAIVDHIDALEAANSAGLGANLMPKLISEIPEPARRMLVAIVLDRVGKKPVMKFPEILSAANTYTDEVNWPGFSREEARQALECLVNYSLVRGGPSIYTKRLDINEYQFEVIPSLEEMLRVPNLETKNKDKLENALVASNRNAVGASSY